MGFSETLQRWFCKYPDTDQSWNWRGALWLDEMEKGKENIGSAAIKSLISQPNSTNPPAFFGAKTHSHRICFFSWESTQLTWWYYMQSMSGCIIKSENVWLCEHVLFTGSMYLYKIQFFSFFFIKISKI